MGRGKELETIRDVVTYLVVNEGKMNCGTRIIVQRISESRKISKRSVEKAIKTLKDSGIAITENEMYIPFVDAPGHWRYASSQLKINHERVWSILTELGLESFRNEIKELPTEIKKELLEYRGLLLQSMIEEEMVTKMVCLEYIDSHLIEYGNKFPNIHEYLQLRDINLILSAFEIWNM